VIEQKAVAGCALVFLLLVDLPLGLVVYLVDAPLLTAIFVLFLLLQLCGVALVTMAQGARSMLRDLRDLNRYLSLAQMGLAALYGPVLGLAVNVYYGPVDPGTGFYETAAQVAAAMLIAAALDNGLRTRPATAEEERVARGISVGIVLGIATAVTAALVAMARDDGSAALFGLTAGGLYFGFAFLLVAAGRERRIPEPGP
jgi:hypothetical protein